MLQSKTISKRAGKKPANHILTDVELDQIRAFLPYNWRQIVNKTHDRLSLRQISKVFSQKTTNPTDNLLVWTAVNEILSLSGGARLSKKVEKKIFYYQYLCDITQKQ